MEDGLGRGFWLKLIGICIALAIGALLLFLVFDRLIYRFGAIGALVVLAAVLIGIAYVYDKRKLREYERNPE